MNAAKAGERLALFEASLKLLDTSDTGITVCRNNSIYLTGFAAFGDADCSQQRSVSSADGSNRPNNIERGTNLQDFSITSTLIDLRFLFLRLWLQRWSKMFMLALFNRLRIHLISVKMLSIRFEA